MIRRNTWILLGVFALLLGVTIYLQSTGKLPVASNQETATPAPTDSPVFKFEMGTINHLSIQRANAKTFKAQADQNGKWSIMEPVTSAIPAEQVSVAVSTIQSWSILTELTNVPALDILGLTPPQAIITLENSNGQTWDIKVGNATPTGNGYYVQVTGSTPIVVSTSSVEPILQLAPIQTPTPTTSLEGH